MLDRLPTRRARQETSGTVKAHHSFPESTAGVVEDAELVPVLQGMEAVVSWQARILERPDHSLCAGLIEWIEEASDFDGFLLASGELGRS
ncbi:hypothetical protein [Muricoccus aerilatus]|uniref:hypothetical protein n=1 Tax=Muricoccus aerilatus TaxID=452982 RepID=UPI0005C20938|nr:hypothetical protein [Roseomonas aerilata]